MTFLKSYSCDFCIIGGGIIGLTIARELLDKKLGTVIILEKESYLGAHASGRNSGILHAGIYYPPDSLKSKFCLRGNRLWKDFCLKNSIPFSNTGKVLVTRSKQDCQTLDLIHARATGQGAIVKRLTKSELYDIEPLAKTVDYALLSVETASVNPMDILGCLKSKLEADRNCRILYSEKGIKISSSGNVFTKKSKIKCSLIINASGSGSDSIAHQVGVGLDYRLIPFKGTYKRLSESYSQKIKHQIYPVPNLDYPFLGIHFTKSVNGNVYIGPTAIPALGAENYSGFEGISNDTIKIVYSNLMLLIGSSAFRQLAKKEPLSYLSHFFYKEASSLIRGLSKEDIVSSSKVGIRPQLVNWREKTLVMDFVVETGENSLHVLNAISPAFTSAIPFAEHLVKKYVS